MEDIVYIIKKDGKGGVLGYHKDSFEKNENALNEYRTATIDEIKEHFDIEEEEKKEDEINPESNSEERKVLNKNKNKIKTNGN